jgi:hypothetical protein
MAVVQEDTNTSTLTSSMSSSIRSRLKSRIDYANMPQVYKIPLWDLNCQFGMVKQKHSTPILLKDAIKYERRNQQADVTLLFAIRTPGCALCREHALQLTELAAADRRLALAATVKETGVAYWNSTSTTSTAFLFIKMKNGCCTKPWVVRS